MKPWQKVGVLAGGFVLGVFAAFGATVYALRSIELWDTTDEDEDTERVSS